MNIYVINEVLIDYSSGMAVIAAPDLARCRELFLAEFNWPARHQDQFDASISNGDFKVIENVNEAEGIISYVYGGG